MRSTVFAVLLGLSLTSARGPQTDQRLAAERAKIDTVDRRLVALLNERPGACRGRAAAGDWSESRSAAE
jgi:hypothetical protein